jgi:uncharacterized protein (DUF433 family)
VPKGPAGFVVVDDRFGRETMLCVRRAGYDGPMTYDRIVIDPKICHGRPVIRGTRMPVTLVVGSLAGGMSFDEVEREYELTADDIRAALRFVADLAAQESFHSLSV